MNTETVFQDALGRIRDDVRAVFVKIREDARLALEDNQHRDVQRQYEDLSRHLQRDLVLHGGLLHDTLVNYLADDALRALESEPAAVKNAYYAARSTWLDAAVPDELPAPLEFEDRRLLIAGGTGLAVLAGLRLLAISSVPLLVAAGAGAAAGALVYRYASHTASLSLSEAVATCLDQAESTTLKSISEAVARYRRTFDEFLREHSIVPSAAAWPADR